MSPERSGRPCRDYAGEEYPSENAMCRAHGVSPATYRRKLKKGFSLKEALTPPPAQAIPCAGPDGTKYPSIAAAARAVGLSTYAVRSRMDRSNPDSSRVITPDAPGPTDHLGKEYPSINAMATTYGITPNTYRTRIQRGLSKKQALTMPLERPTRRGATDFDGNRFPNAKAMCQHWNVNLQSVSARKSECKIPYAEALRSVIAHSWPGKAAGGMQIIKCIQWPWFLCHMDGETDVILHARKIAEKFRTEG